MLTLDRTVAVSPVTGLACSLSLVTVIVTPAESSAIVLALPPGPLPSWMFTAIV